MPSLSRALLALGYAAFVALAAEPPYVLRTGPPVFSYPELVKLSEAADPPAALAGRLKTLLTTPFVSNEAFYRNARPHRPVIRGLGPSLRVVQWNIERGLELDHVKLAFADSRAFLAKAESSTTGAVDGKKSEPKPFDAGEVARIRAGLSILQSADVIVLNEVDWGVKRTGYRCVVCELGSALNMNWAWGVEFVEVDPVILGTEKFEEVSDPQERAKMQEAVAVDKSRLRALHGTAVLSRYPIRGVTLVPFEHKSYDWYGGEQKIPVLEKGKRTASVLVGEKLGREIRRGGRTNLIVTLDVPDVPEHSVTIAATHLENRADPKDRRIEMEELLAKLHDLRMPVILAGDLNTTGSKSTPRSVLRTVRDKIGTTEFAATTALKYATGIGIYQTIAFGSFKAIRFQSDPTAAGVKILAENPERPLFQTLEAFRFSDGTALDFRGVKGRISTGNDGTLADSNERAGKGFAATFQFERTLGAKGKFKLDWIFVKPYIESPRSEAEPYRFAPHFGRTLAAVNYAFPDRLSDHNPISADLPFREPQLGKSPATSAAPKPK